MSNSVMEFSAYLRFADMQSDTSLNHSPVSIGAQQRLGLPSDVLSRNLQSLIQQARSLLDELMVAMSSGMARLSETDRKIQQALIDEQFAQVRKQIESQKFSLLFKIFMPLLMALGVVMLALAPVDPITKATLIGVLALVLVDSLVQAVTGEGFLDKLFEKMANNDESLANWLKLGFEALIAMLTVAVSFGCSLQSAVQCVKQLPEKLNSLLSHIPEGASAAANAVRQTLNKLIGALRQTGTIEVQNARQSLSQVLGVSSDNSKGVSARLLDWVEKVRNSNVGEAFSKAVISGRLDKAGETVLLLSSMVTGAMNIDTQFLKMQLARISHEVDLLQANADLIDVARKRQIDAIQELSDVSALLDQQMQAALSVYAASPYQN